MITIHIPKNGECPDLGKEMSSARNIQDKSVRESTLSGLNAIRKYI